MTTKNKTTKATTKAKAPTTTNPKQQRAQLIEQVFESADKLGQHKELISDILELAVNDKAMRKDFLEACELKAALLADDELATFKKEIKGMQNVFNKPTYQARLLGKDRETKMYFGKVKTGHIVDGFAKDSELGSYKILELPLPPKTEKAEDPDLATVIGDWIEKNQPKMLDKTFADQMKNASVMLVDLVQPLYNSTYKTPDTMYTDGKPPKAKATANSIIMNAML